MKRFLSFEKKSIGTFDLFIALHALIAISDEARRLVGVTAIMREADRNLIGHAGE
jgi:hypothetical protein